MAAVLRILNISNNSKITVLIELMQQSQLRPGSWFPHTLLCVGELTQAQRTILIVSTLGTSDLEAF